METQNPFAEAGTSPPLSLDNFVSALFPALGVDAIEIRTLPSRVQGYATNPDPVPDIEAFATKHGHENVYFGVATRTEKNGAFGGTAEHCGIVNALFVDYDWKTMPEANVRARLVLCPTPPSIIVSTGGGLHVYWLLKEPLAANLAPAWLRRLAAAMQSDPAATDAARILRLPGTLNHKYDPPRPVTVETCEPARRYALDDFSWLQPEPAGSGRAAPRPASEWTKVVGGVAGGHRQEELPRVVGLYYSKLPPEVARASAHSYGRGCEPPLSEAEVDACCDRIERREAAKVQAARVDVAPVPSLDERGNVVDGLRVTSFANVEAQNVDWLWKDYIPAGMLTLLSGDPEEGKSTVAFDLAARVTTGASWPNGAPGGAPARVIFLASEDSPAHTMKPRLQAAGADVTMAGWVESNVIGGKEEHVSLQRDLDALDTAWQRSPFALLVIDPVNAYLPGVDTHRDNDVRGILTPLARWAEARRVTILAIMHFGKNLDRNAKQRILGSTAFVAAARATYACCRDAESGSGGRLFLNSKLSVAPKPDGFKYEFEPRTVIGRGGVIVHTVGIRWGERTTITADQALRNLTTSTRERGLAAESFLKQLLADEPVTAKEGEARATAAGITPATLKRARVTLQMKSRRVGGIGPAGVWYWMPLDWTDQQASAWQVTAWTKALKEVHDTPQESGG